MFELNNPAPIQMGTATLRLFTSLNRPNCLPYGQGIGSARQAPQDYQSMWSAGRPPVCRLAPTKGTGVVTDDPSSHNDALLTSRGKRVLRNVGLSSVALACLGLIAILLPRDLALLIYTGILIILTGVLVAVTVALYRVGKQNGRAKEKATEAPAIPESPQAAQSRDEHQPPPSDEPGTQALAGDVVPDGRSGSDTSAAA
jgi:hypothetical protein